MTDLTYIRDRYLTERPKYRELALRAKGALETACFREGLSPKLECREKDPGSLLKKALTRQLEGGSGSPKVTYEEIIDKAGVRATVLDTVTRDAVANVASQLFEIHKVTDKGADFALDKFAYRGLHLRASLRAAPGHLEGLMFELQIRTLGASLWAEVAHDLTYKPLPSGVPQDVERAVHRLSAVLELVDQEVARVRTIVSAASGADQAEVLVEIEKQFLRLAGKDYNHELTAALLPQLMWVTSGQSVAQFLGELRLFFQRNEEKLGHVFGHYGDDSMHPVLQQPEGLLILYARERDEFGLRDNWPALLPQSELETFEAIWTPTPGGPRG